MRDYSQPKCNGEQEKSIRYECFICTSRYEHKFRALSLRRAGPCPEPQTPLAASLFCSLQPARITGSTGQRHAPCNSASSPTSTSQPRTHKIWTRKQPLSSKWHVEGTVLYSFKPDNCSTYPSLSSSVQSGTTVLTCANKPNTFKRPSQPESLTWMLLSPPCRQSSP